MDKKENSSFPTLDISDTCPLVSGHPTVETSLVSDLDLRFSNSTTNSSFGRKDAKTVRFDPLSRLFCVKVDTENELQNRNLVSLLNAHSYGVPLVVSFNVQDSRDVKQHSIIRSVFHCPRCYLLWEISGKLPLVCHEPPQIIRGPATMLSTNDAILLIDVLNWKKKFVTSELKSAFALLRRETSSIEKNLILKSVSRRKISASNDFERDQKQLLGLAVEEAIIKKNAILITAARNMALSRESEINRYLDDFGGEIKIIGMKENEGNFYPGFFSLHSSAGSTVVTENTVEENRSFHRLKHDHFLDFEFVARGRYDQKGHFHSFESSHMEHAHLYAKENFPSLLSATAAQLRQKLLSADDSPDLQSELASLPPSTFCFSMKEGFEFDLANLFANGLWFADATNEFMFPGVFDGSDKFIASYCISKQGYFIPGCTNERGKFLPFSKYGAYEHKAVKLHKYSKNLNQDKMNVLEKLKELPKFPLAHEIPHSSRWFCFKDKTIISEPRLITVPFGHITVTNENLNVYIGGEKGPDKLLYLYGQYDKEDQFFPGSPAINSELEFCVLPPNESGTDPLDILRQRFGIYLRTPTYLVSHPNHSEGSSSDTRPTPELRISLDRKNKTPSSSLDDAAWFALKQAAMSQKEEESRGRMGFSNNPKLRGKSEARSTDKEVASDVSSILEGSDRGSESPASKKGMAWFTKQQKNLYELLSMSEDENVRLDSEVKKESSASVSKFDRQHKLAKNTSTRPNIAKTREAKNTLLDGEKKMFEGSGILMKTSDRNAENLSSSSSPSTLSSLGRFKDRQSTMAGVLTPTRFQHRKTDEGLNSETSDDGGGIGIVGGVGLVTKSQITPKDRKEFSSRKHVDTNSVDYLIRTPRASLSRKALTKLVKSKKHGSSAPEVNVTAVKLVQEQLYRSEDSIRRDQKQKQGQSVPTYNRVSTYAKPRDNKKEPDANVAKSRENKKKLEVNEEVSATPPDFEEAKIRADSLKNRLQALGNLKERLDGAASDENKDDMFTEETAKKPVFPRHLVRIKRKSTFESDFLPKLSGSDFSALNFTSSVSFSYFTMPGHVKDFNKQVRHGALKLPEIASKKKLKSELEKPKRARKLNKFKLEDPVHSI